MLSLLLLAATSLALSLIFTPACRHLFRHWRVLDRQDRDRDTQGIAIPRAGGLPIALASAAAFAILVLSPLHDGEMVQHILPIAWKLLPGVALVFATGLLDDLFALKPWQKLLAEGVAGAWMFAAGVKISGVAGYSIGYWWSLPLTLAWFIGCTNSFNLIDGVDGLAAGLGFFATLTTLIAALLQRNTALAIATAPLAGSLLGFLRYNFNPASIYLGDSGSLLVGFLLGCYGVIWSQESATLLGMTSPLIALAIPIVDVALSVLRRFLRGRPIFTADRGHIHHMLLKRGLTPRRVVFVMYGVAGLFAAFSLLLSAFQSRLAGIIIILFCAVTWIGIHNLGYLEFRMAGRILMGKTFQKVLKGQLALSEFEAAIQSANTVDECWDAIRLAGADAGFTKMEMWACDRRYQTCMETGDAKHCWQARISLSEGEWLNFATSTASASPLLIASDFLNSARVEMRAKLAQWRVLPQKVQPRVEMPRPRTAQAGD